MKSARQAWHDCFFIPSKDRLQMLQESAAPVKSGQFMYRKVWFVDESRTDADGKPAKYFQLSPLLNAKQDDSYHGDFFTYWDPIWRAKVKRAIKSLSKPLRCFGMYMYAPQSEISDDDTELVQYHVRELFYEFADQKELKNWRVKTHRKLDFLVLAAMKYYRDQIYGGRSELSTPMGISSYLKHNFGERLVADNWQRDWQDHWSKLIAIFNEMEKNTLRPVASVLPETDNAAETA